jgi:imidazolonepropionase-like amidohydrolase
MRSALLPSLLALAALVSQPVLYAQRLPAPAAKPPASSHPAAPEGAAAFERETAPVIALTHATLFDGTGTEPKHDQTVVIEDGRIAAVGASAAIPPGARVIDLTGKTLLPGLIGMHEHLFYPAAGADPSRNNLYAELADSAPRLYLGVGITTARTAGSIEPFTDIALKQAIDSGKDAGPTLDVTGPYLEGKPSIGLQLHELTGPDDARALVNYWGDRGATSFKAYMHITPDELKAAIDAAHARGAKITGHLCSIGFREAAALGIDNLEHGLVVDTEFFPGKQEGVCPGQAPAMAELAKSVDVQGPEVQAMIHDLVAHHVAVTSTLAIFESFVPDEPALEDMHPVQKALSLASWDDYATRRGMVSEHAKGSDWPVLLKKEMEFERSFLAAGGLLMAGCDPTGYGGVLAGYGDQREMELLVAAGFTPAQAVQIYSSNAARFLGKEAVIGTIAVGKQADLLVLDGDFESDAKAITRPELVFKQGLGFDAMKLQQSVSGVVGLR